MVSLGMRIYLKASLDDQQQFPSLHLFAAGRRRLKYSISIANKSVLPLSLLFNIYPFACWSDSRMV